MRSLLSIFKNSLRTITAIIALIFVCVYVASRYNLTGYLAKQLLANDISEYLGTEVTVENADVDIFNQVVLEQLLVKDLESDTLLFARRAKVSFDLLPLLNNKLAVHSIQFIDFDINLSRKDSLSDTNFKFLVDILATPKSSKSSIEDIKVNSIFLRSGSISYDDYSRDSVSRRLLPWSILTRSRKALTSGILCYRAAKTCTMASVSILILMVPLHTRTSNSMLKSRT